MQRTARHRNVIVMSSIAAMSPNHIFWLQDFTEAYIQRHDLQRDIYVKLADQFKLSQDSYLKLLKNYKDYLNQEIHGSVNTNNSSKIIKTANNRWIIIISV